MSNMLSYSATLRDAVTELHRESYHRESSVSSTSTAYDASQHQFAEQTQSMHVPGSYNVNAPFQRIKKRIIVCCDGTWQDGIEVKRHHYTNVLRMARMINHEDNRFSPAIPQVVFYQTGVGTDDNFYSKWVDGGTGATLGDKVQEAYAFIAHNYQPGDEIYLFGFSRGAYTARMVALFIGEIGVLDRTDMDYFASIFIAYQKRGMMTTESDIAQLNTILHPWTNEFAPGKVRVHSQRADKSFSIKCLAVWDTVGSLGLPMALSCPTRSKKVQSLFGFRDNILGAHIERAYHAIALNETRADFAVAKFEQSTEGWEKGQILKQCWFAGDHSDVGGGYHEHDLANITLAWMTANICDTLSIDTGYLARLRQPVAPWGQQPPHNPLTGFYILGGSTARSPPVAHSSTTLERVHWSVLSQKTISAGLKETLNRYPDLLEGLMPLEIEMKNTWPFDATVAPASPAQGIDKLSFSTVRGLAKVGRDLSQEVYDRVQRERMKRTKAHGVPLDPNWISSIKNTRDIGDYYRTAADEY